MPPLDGLRGLAIALVILFHASIVRPLSAAGEALHDLFRNFGWCGVDLFFVLSGFLITGLLYDAKGSPRARRNFYARRVLRIFPVYYGFLFLAFILGPALYPEIGKLVSAGGDEIFYWLYLQNFAIADAGDWAHSTYLNLFWSLAIEEQFYLAWPFAVLACGRRTLLRLCAAAIVLAPLLRAALVEAEVAPVSIYVLTPARIDTLAVGAWLALAARGEGGIAPLRRPARAVLFASAAGIAAVAWRQGGFDGLLPLSAMLGYSLLALFFGALMVLSLCAPPRAWLSRVLCHPAARALGRYSYTLYVTHLVALMLCARILAWLAEGTGFAIPNVLLQLVLYALVFASATVFAALSWRCYERPILSLKRRVPMGRGAAPAAASARADPGE